MDGSGILMDQTMGSSMECEQGMYRRLNVWELGSLWSWECCERDEGLEHGDVDGAVHENMGRSPHGKGIKT